MYIGPMIRIGRIGFLIQVIFCSVSSISVVSVPLLGQAKQAAGVRTWQKWTIQGPGTDNTLIVRLFSPGKTVYVTLEKCNTLGSSDFFVKSAFY